MIIVIIVGIAGGTGSGKTTFAQALQGAMGEDCVIISQDSYYVANTDLSFSERLKINYDHPDALEDELLIEHLRKLQKGEAIEVPVYDFESYARTSKTIRVEPHRIVIVEGILVLVNPELRAQFDLKVFVDTDPDVRILRRLVRDVQERGRSLESVHAQYLQTVKPMHEAFVEPSKKYADLIVPEGGHNQVALETVAAVLRQYVQDGENRLVAATRDKG
ncbi:MAG: uridine kinase [Firmicutes bacterium]|nr:uridine kinase [Bacillota bacterium]